MLNKQYIASNVIQFHTVIVMRWPIAEISKQFIVTINILDHIHINLFILGNLFIEHTKMTTHLTPQPLSNSFVEINTMNWHQKSVLNKIESISAWIWSYAYA